MDVAARINSGGVAGLNLEELAHLNKLAALESLFATKKLFSFYQVVQCRPIKVNDFHQNESC